MLLAHHESGSLGLASLIASCANYQRPEDSRDILQVIELLASGCLPISLVGERLPSLCAFSIKSIRIV